MSESHAVAYEALRTRVTELTAKADTDALAARCPATPAWTVRDVVAHLVGVTDDVVNGRLEGIASNEWTGKQVEARQGMAMTDLLAEWEQTGPAFEAIMAGVPEEVSGQALFDAFTHEQDIRCALGIPGGRETDAAAIAWEWMANARAGMNGPAIRIVTESDDISGGGDGPRTTVRASRFELLRAATGRRTRAEMAAYDWDPEPNVDLLVTAEIFSIPAQSLNE